jgi:hypothetical protein
VFFEERHIGNVRDAQYTDQGDYLVDVSIREEFDLNGTAPYNGWLGTGPSRVAPRQLFEVFESCYENCPLSRLRTPFCDQKRFLNGKSSYELRGIRYLRRAV